MSHLLLVEDDDDLREDLAAILEHKGYKVRTASNGADALDDLRRTETPCLILLDLMMPVMDGWRFRQEQLQDNVLAGIPVLVMTGVSESTGALQAIKVLRKPVRIEQLLQLIGERCTARAAVPD